MNGLAACGGVRERARERERARVTECARKDVDTKTEREKIWKNL